MPNLKKKNVANNQQQQQKSNHPNLVKKKIHIQKNKYIKKFTSS